MEKHIEIAGKALRMKYTVNSLCAIEDHAGTPIGKLLEKEYSAARLLLWGGLIECHPDMKVCEVGALISAHIADGGTLEEIIDLCAEGLKDAGFFGCAAK